MARCGGCGVRLAGVCVALAVLLTTAAAGGSPENRQAAALVSAETAATGGEHVVSASIKGFQFVPSRIEVSPDTTVLWINKDGVAHEVTLLDRELTSPLVGRGGKIAVVFRDPGKYRYYCGVHPFMQGTVIVR